MPVYTKRLWTYKKSFPQSIVPSAKNHNSTSRPPNQFARFHTSIPEICTVIPFNFACKASSPTELICLERREYVTVKPDAKWQCATRLIFRRGADLSFFGIRWLRQLGTRLCIELKCTRQMTNVIGDESMSRGGVVKSTWGTGNRIIVDNMQTR